jgi:hypothetical protein
MFSACADFFDSFQDISFQFRIPLQICRRLCSKNRELIDYFAKKHFRTKLRFLTRAFLESLSSFSVENFETAHQSGKCSLIGLRTILEILTRNGLEVWQCGGSWRTEFSLTTPKIYSPFTGKREKGLISRDWKLWSSSDSDDFHFAMKTSLFGLYENGSGEGSVVICYDSPLVVTVVTVAQWWQWWQWWMVGVVTVVIMVTVVTGTVVTGTVVTVVNGERGNSSILFARRGWQWLSFEFQQKPLLCTSSGRNVAFWMIE